MTSDHVVGAERAARVRERRAEMEAVLDAQRRRPLPAWLSSRRNRRTLALLPVVVLVGAVVTAALPNGDAQGTLSLVLLWASAALALRLRRATRLLDAVPDRLLDEREISERNDANRRAYRLVTALLFLLVALAAANLLLTDLAGFQLVRGNGWPAILMGTAMVATMLPSAVIAWRWVEPVGENDEGPEGVDGDGPGPGPVESGGAW